MEDGRILAASHDGAYVLRLCGDVRVNLCTTIEDYFQSMYDDPDFASVWIDLCDAQGIDSTTLGVLAKLSLAVQEKFGFKPAVYASNPGIVRLFESMGLHKLFDIRQEVCTNPDDIAGIPAAPGDPEEVKATVIEAHEVLMGLSDENRARFQDLMNALDPGKDDSASETPAPKEKKKKRGSKK